MKILIESLHTDKRIFGLFSIYIYTYLSEGASLADLVPHRDSEKMIMNIKNHNRCQILCINSITAINKAKIQSPQAMVNETSVSSKIEENLYYSQ